LTYQLQALGKQTLLFNLPPDQPVDTILPRVLGYQVDGLIIASTTPSNETAEQCRQYGTPVVLINRQAPASQTYAVCCDSETATRQVADLLLDGNHQRLAYIAGIANTDTNHQRQKGFTEQLQARGYANLQREQGDYTYESGAAAARRLLHQSQPPDAIFCAADIMALGAIDVARYEFGLNVTKQLSIVGFDDIPAAHWPAYNLTTVRQPIEEMVTAVIHLLAGPSPTMTQLLPGELIIRGSVRTK
jgi:DNA-binding LacI/PurR family transcriptional regulator